VATGDTSATVADRFNRSRFAAPLAAFNAMVLVAIKLLGGNSASASAAGHGATNPTSIAALGRANHHDDGAA
jgi:hypothetical protein